MDKAEMENPVWQAKPENWRGLCPCKVHCSVERNESGKEEVGSGQPKETASDEERKAGSPAWAPQGEEAVTHQQLYDFEIEWEGLKMVKVALWGPDPDFAFDRLLSKLNGKGFRVTSQSDVSYLQIGTYEPKEGPVLVSWVDAANA